jgi:hypothetical protein
VKIEVPPKLLELIRALSPSREVEHCGAIFEVSAFDIYGTCPECQKRIKVRSFSDGVELEDVFDAVFEWMERTEADEIVERRRQEIREDLD